MEALLYWVRNLICCFCILELMYHLVQNASYQKYLRFFGGLIFILIVLEPLFEIGNMQSIFEEAFYLSSWQEEGVKLQEAAGALLELQNEKIEEAYQKEMERQIKEYIQRQEGEETFVKVDLKREVSSGIPKVDKITVSLKMPEKAGEAFSLRQEIADCYGIREEMVVIKTNGS